MAVAPISLHSHQLAKELGITGTLIQVVWEYTEVMAEKSMHSCASSEASYVQCTKCHQTMEANSANLLFFAYVMAFLI